MGAAGFATAAFGMANDDLAKLGLARGFKEFEVRTSRQLPGEVSEISAEIQAVFTEARDWLLLHGGAPSLGLVVLEASAREKTWNSAPQLVAEFDRRAVDATRSFIEKLTRDARLRSLTTIVTALQWVPPTYPDRAVLSIHLPHGAPDSHAIAGAVSLLDVAPTLLRLFDLPALPGARGGFLLDPRRPADAPLACTTPLAIVGGDVDDVLLRIGPIACTWPGEWATLDWNRTCRVTGSLHREAFEKGLVTPTTALRPELRDELQRLLRDSFGYEIRADPTPKDMLEWELGFDRLRDDCYSPLPPLPDCSPDANDRIQCPHFVGSQQQ